MDFAKLFSDFNSIKIAIVGDVMLDSYWWGNVERISPEAPVPVVSMQHKELRVGGAANVALNVVSLGAQTSIFSVIGSDEDGNQLISLLEKNRINTSYIITSDKRITTNKTRVMSRNQQMMRLDAEIVTDIDKVLEDALIENVEKYFSEAPPDVLIFEDYNKGVLTERVINTLIALCKKHNVVTTVDPKRKNFLSFKGVTIFKPNLKEIKEGLNLLIDPIDDNSLQQMHAVLRENLQHEISFITLSENGVFYQQDNKRQLIPTHVPNIAGGLVCEEVGTAAINKDKLLAECELLLKK